MGDIEARFTVPVTFRGKSTRVFQDKRAKGEDGIDNTGWQVWECSNLMLRYVGDDGQIADAIQGAAPVTNLIDYDASANPQTFNNLKLLDMSAGAGLIALACAEAGAHVWASDIPPQLPQLVDNIRRNGLDGRVGVISAWWGENIDTLRPGPLVAVPTPAADPHGYWYDMCIASDILYIALRDGYQTQLSQTIRDLCAVCKCVLFGFEEREVYGPNNESDWMRGLEGPLEPHGQASADADALTAQIAAVAPEGSRISRALRSVRLEGLEVLEIRGDACVISRDEALQGVGGFKDTECGMGASDMFWEPPPIRMFVLRSKVR